MVLAVSLLLFLALGQELNMFGRDFFVVGDPLLGLTFEGLTLLAPLFEVLLALSRNLQVSLHALFNFFLGFSVLGEEHLPSPDVVHGLIFVRHQVAFYQGTIFHCQFDTGGLGLLLP